MQQKQQQQRYGDEPTNPFGHRQRLLEARREAIKSPKYQNLKEEKRLLEFKLGQLAAEDKIRELDEKRRKQEQEQQQQQRRRIEEEEKRRRQKLRNSKATISAAAEPLKNGERKMTISKNRHRRLQHDELNKKCKRCEAYIIDTANKEGNYRRRRCKNRVSCNALSKRENLLYCRVHLTRMLSPYSQGKLTTTELKVLSDAGTASQKIFDILKL